MYHVLYSIACYNPATGCYMIINNFSSQWTNSNQTHSNEENKADQIKPKGANSDVKHRNENKHKLE